MTSIDDILPPPSDAVVADALRGFVARVRARYGAEFRGAYLFGSRARGDHEPRSDVDLAILFRPGGWSPLSRSMDLAGMAFDEIVAHGVEIQPHAVDADRWLRPGEDEEGAFLKRIARDAVPVEAAA